jgi:hypothetical protein
LSVGPGPLASVLTGVRLGKGSGVPWDAISESYMEIRIVFTRSWTMYTMGRNARAKRQGSGR